MPLSEFLRMARGNLESGQEKKASCLEDDLAELVWENGQIMVQGHSSRAKKIPTINNLPSNGPRIQEKCMGNSSNSKIGKFGVMDTMLPLSVPGDEMDLTEEDEMVPWLSYSENYRSPMLPEVSGGAVNETSGQRGFESMDKRGSSNQVNGDSHSVPIHNTVNLEQRNVSKLSPPASILPLGSGVSDVIRNNTSNNTVSAFGDLNSRKDSTDGIKSMTTQTRNLPGSSSGLLNFSHFQRSRTLLKDKLQNITEGTAVSGSSVIEARVNKERENVASSSNRVTDVLIEPCDNLFRDGPNNNDKSFGQFSGVNATKQIPDGERNVEPAVVCSSVCSGSSAERASSDHPRTLKRKTHHNEESDLQSEDVEEDSIGVKNAGLGRGGIGSKRSRAAEVHNLSERRRRDRINEKMRALQELVPNCNKADKASMLDEAIEYLKTLQLQVQIMSMGAGLYGPPMMFPAGMQHMHAAHMPHFSPMGLGMGMGFGMGTFEMNGGSPGCPIYPIPAMQGSHFPGVGSSPHAFGNPARGIPMSVPRAPLVPLAGQPSASSSAGLNVTRPGVHADVPNATPTPILDPKNQVQATNEDQGKSALVRKE